jgi:hypothetical protein
MYAGGFKQVLYKEYICWIQVKIHISDQTSLRICNKVSIKIRTRYSIYLVESYLEVFTNRMVSPLMPVMLAHDTFTIGYEVTVFILKQKTDTFYSRLALYVSIRCAQYRQMTILTSAQNVTTRPFVLYTLFFILKVLSS